MEEQENDFLKNIKKELQAQEDPYQQGAWEQFLLHQKGKNHKTIPLFSAGFKMAVAAVGLLVVGLFGYLFLKDNSKINNSTVDIVQKNQKKKNENTQINTDTATSEKIINISAAKISLFAKKPVNKNKPVASTSVTSAIPPQKEIQDPTTAIDSTKNMELAKQEIIQKETSIPTQKNNHPNNNKPQQSLVDWAQTTSPIKKQQIESKWSPSFYVAPIINDAGVNMSFGVGLDFKVNQKFVISSGAEYTKLESEVNTLIPIQNNPAMMTKNSTANRAAVNNTASSNYQLNNSVSGIKIPLSITYNVSNKFYATTGLSGLLVLANKGDISFTSVNNERITVSTNKGQIIEEKEVTFSNTVTDKDLKYHTNASLKNDINTFNHQKSNSFIPFYNAAIGIKQSVGKNKSIALEPFVQIPLIQNNTSKYTGGGIRLKINL